MVVTKYAVSIKMIASKLLTRQCNFPCLFVVVTSPLDLFQQVSEVRPDWDVVLPRPKLVVEMLVVAGILL